MAKAEISWRRITKDGIRVDWLKLLDAVQRRINRRLLPPEAEARVTKLIRERFPEAKLA